MSVEVIGLAVGLFALTNIDEHLDRKCTSQSEGSGCANSTRD